MSERDKEFIWYLALWHLQEQKLHLLVRFIRQLAIWKINLGHFNTKQ